MPKVGATVFTNDGAGVVDSVDLLNKKIKAKIQNEDGGISINEYKLADIKSATQYNDISDDEDDGNDAE